jgi:trk system potassium uptake protein TrkH
VSAFATVGLSTGLTPNLTDAGKVIVVLLMFVGRIGPIVFLSAIQRLHGETAYKWPDKGMLIG